MSGKRKRDERWRDRVLRDGAGSIAGRYAQLGVGDIKAVEAYIEATGVLDHLAQWDEEDGRADHTGGREMVLQHRHIAIAMMLLARERLPLWATEVGKLFRSRLTAAARKYLQLPDGNHREFEHDRVKFWDNAAANAFDRFVRPMDAYEGVPRNALLTRAERERLKKYIESTRTYKVRMERLATFTSRMILPSLDLLPASLRETMRAEGINVSIDETPVVSVSQRGVAARHKKTGRELRDSFVLELEAGWYAKHARDRHGNVKMVDGKPTTSFVWGYGATLVALCAPNDMSIRVPHIVVGFSLAAPHRRVAQEAILVLKTLTDSGLKPGLITADRGYFAHFPADTLLRPVRSMGWDIVTDWGKRDLGPEDGTNGSILLEDGLFCPATPEHLQFIATSDLDERTKESWYRARRPFRLHAKERPSTAGTQRFRCPAHGPAASVICPLRNRLMGEQPKSGLQLVRSTGKKPGQRKPPKILPRVHEADLPKEPPKICVQESVTFKVEVFERRLQRITWGTSEWKRRYRADRDAIEGQNSYLKAGGYEELAEPSRRRFRGLPKQQVAITFLIVSANQRLIRSFIAAEEKAAILGPRERPQSRRDRIGYHNYTEAARSKPSFDLARAEERERRVSRRGPQSKPQRGQSDPNNRGNGPNWPSDSGQRKDPPSGGGS